MAGAVVMQTPYNMPTATTAVGRINHQAELRLQRTVTQIEIKQRQAMLKMNRKIREIVQELYSIRKGFESEPEQELDAELKNQSTKIDEAEPDADAEVDGDPKQEKEEKLKDSGQEHSVELNKQHAGSGEIKLQTQFQLVSPEVSLSANKGVKSVKGVGSSSVKGVSWTSGKAKHSKKKSKKTVKKTVRIKAS